MSESDWFHQPHGGPWSVEELKRRHPQMHDGIIEERRRCVASPLYLASSIMSCMWPKNLLATPSSAHREVERAMIDQADTLYVDARGTAKTTLLIEVGSVAQFVKYPNDTQLLTHSTAANAKALSNSVRVHLTHNPKFRAVFPEYALNDDANILGWSVPCRQLGGREESIEVATPGTATAGRHYVVVRASDWMNENTTPLYGLATLEMMNALVALFSQVQGMLLGKEVCERAHWTCDSNRWHDGDKAGTLIRRDATRNTIRKIIRGVTGPSGNFVSSWPEVKTPEMIQAIFDSPTMTPAMFAANYRSDPLPDGGMAFKREWFHEYDRLPVGTKLAIIVDPAFSDSKSEANKTDRTGIVVSGFAPNGNLYVADTAAGRWGADEFVRRVFDFAVFWKAFDPLLWLGVEDTGGSRGIATMLEHEFRRTRRDIFVRKLKPAGKRKDQRIFNLHRIAEGLGGIHVKPHHNELVEELMRFGVAEHDDLADCLAYRVMEHYFGDKERDEDRPKLRSVPSGRDDSSEGLIARINQRHEEATRPSWRARRLTKVG